METIILWKSRLSKTGAVLCTLAVLCVLDGSVDFLRTPSNSLYLLQGDSARLTGPLAPGVSGIEGMKYESDSQAVRVSFEGVITGFWLGGRMWRGTVRLSDGIQPGGYVLSVFGKEDGKKVGANIFKIIVYRDKASRSAGSCSFAEKLLGVSPWVTALSFFGIAVVVCSCLYVISGKHDRLLAERGEAEIYRVVENESGFSIYFGLGRRNGLEEGARLVLMNAKQQPVEEAVVESVSENDGLACVGPLSRVKPGYLVKMC